MNPSETKAFFDMFGHDYSILSPKLSNVVFNGDSYRSAAIVAPLLEVPSGSRGTIKRTFKTNGCNGKIPRAKSERTFQRSSGSA